MFVLSIEAKEFEAINNWLPTLMSYKNTEIRNCYIESEAEVIAVKIQDFKRKATSWLSYRPLKQ